jgi:uncharacterized protein (TIRG00374 family)
MRPASRKIIFLLLILVVLAALAYRSRGSIGLEGFSWTQLAASVQSADLSLLLLSIVAIHICYALRAVRWVFFSRHLARASLANIYSSTLIGFSSIFLLGRAGEPIRPLLIARKDAVPVSSTFGIYVLERLFGMTSTGLLAAIALLAVKRETSNGGEHPLLTATRTSGALMLVGLAVAVGFLVYFRLHGASALARRVEAWRTSGLRGWRMKLAGILTGFSEGLQAIRTWSDLFIAVAISALHWGLVGLIYFWISHSFGGRLAQLDFFDALLVLALTMAGSTLQLPGVGGGTQVASFLAYTAIFGVDKEPAAAAAIVLWLITFAGSTLLGIPLLIKEGWSMGELRSLARAEREAKARGAHVSIPPAARARGDSLR